MLSTEQGFNAWSIASGGTIQGSWQWPSAIMAWYNGTAYSPAVRIVWTLSQDDTCLDDDDYEMGDLTYIFESGLPTIVSAPTLEAPSWGAGEYYMCAMIDADGAMSETCEGDNIIRSELKLELY